MKAEHAEFSNKLGRLQQPLDDLATIGDEGSGAASGPPLAVRCNDASNASFRWFVVEKNAPASVYLDVDEFGCKDCLSGKLD